MAGRNGVAGPPTARRGRRRRERSVSNSHPTSAINPQAAAHATMRWSWTTRGELGQRSGEVGEEEGGIGLEGVGPATGEVDGGCPRPPSRRRARCDRAVPPLDGVDEGASPVRRPGWWRRDRAASRAKVPDASIKARWTARRHSATRVRTLSSAGVSPGRDGAVHGPCAGAAGPEACEEPAPRRSWPEPVGDRRGQRVGVDTRGLERLSIGGTSLHRATVVACTSTWNCTPRPGVPPGRPGPRSASFVASTVLRAGNRVTSAPCHCKSVETAWG